MPERNIGSANIGHIQLAEQGSAPATPASGLGRLYAKADGLYYVDDAGTEFTVAGDSLTLSSLTATTADINGGSIDGATIAVGGGVFIAAWVDQFGTTEFTQDVYVSRSTDDGATWPRTTGPPSRSCAPTGVPPAVIFSSSFRPI